MKKSHACHNVQSRKEKATNILTVIRKFGIILSHAHCLNIGTGSGIIDSILGEKVRLTSVDIVDEREIKTHYTFKKVPNSNLPFPDAYFDCVISNQTIEHIYPEEQLNHIRESYRVLKPGGIMYIATPNKYSLIEPHYRLPLLSILPQRIANFVVKLMGKNEIYDVFPLNYFQLQSYANKSRFTFYNALPYLIKHRTYIKHSPLVPLLQIIPTTVLEALTCVSPSFVAILVK